MKTIVEKLRVMGACDGPGDAIPWVLSRPWSRQTIAALWEDCPRADWMLWLAQRCRPNPEEMGSVAWAFANLAQAYAEGSGSESYAVYFARDAAYDAASAAAAADAYDAAYAAYAAAAYAAYAAAAAAYAAAYDAYDDAQKDCADMVRLLVTCPVLP